MVAGKLKVAMGLQKSPANNLKPLKQDSSPNVRRKRKLLAHWKYRSNSDELAEISVRISAIATTSIFCTIAIIVVVVVGFVFAFAFSFISDSAERALAEISNIPAPPPSPPLPAPALKAAAVPPPSPPAPVPKVASKTGPPPPPPKGLKPLYQQKLGGYLK